jgi:A/G-specific adenine glycosylase
VAALLEVKMTSQNMRKINAIVSKLLDWYPKNARDLPWRHTNDPYALAVAEIMLQQTQVKTVLPYWERWMRELPTIQAAASASPDKIHKLWEGLGYYTRARNLQKAARQIVEKHDGKFPDNFDDVLTLPGIGRYTAGAVCSIAFNQPTPILDGNVIRVLTRIFGVAENPREKKTNAQLWQLAAKLVSHAKTPSSQRKTFLKNFAAFAPLRERNSCSFLNQSLMELGALICTPRQPQCPVCPVKKLCVAFRENRAAELPNPGRRITTTARRFIAFVIERNGKFLVRQRPAGIVNAHLWEFPNTEFNDANAKDAFKSIFGTSPPALEPLCTFKHSITRYRIKLEAWRVSFGGASSARPQNKSGRRGTPPSGKWLTPAKMDSLALTSAHRKILERLNSKITQPANGNG